VFHERNWEDEFWVQFSLYWRQWLKVEEEALVGVEELSSQRSP
jgi:hypothetical protein